MLKNEIFIARCINLNNSSGSLSRSFDIVEREFYVERCRKKRSVAEFIKTLFVFLCLLSLLIRIKLSSPLATTAFAKATRELILCSFRDREATNSITFHSIEI